MLRKKTFKREKTHNGTLRTLVRFRHMEVADDFYEAESIQKEYLKCWAEIYGVTLTDTDFRKRKFTLNILSSETIKNNGVTDMVVLKIRDPLGSFRVKNSDTVVIEDPRFKNVEWGVVDVKPDFYNRRYLLVTLSGGDGVDRN